MVCPSRSPGKCLKSPELDLGFSPRDGKRWQAGVFVNVLLQLFWCSDVSSSPSQLRYKRGRCTLICMLTQVPYLKTNQNPGGRTVSSLSTFSVFLNVCTCAGAWRRGDEASYPGWRVSITVSSCPWCFPYKNKQKQKNNNNRTIESDQPPPLQGWWCEDQRKEGDKKAVDKCKRLWSSQWMT